MEAQTKLTWLEQTEIRVVVSHEQGEVATFAEWGLEIEPHRRIMKERDLEEEFKDATHPFRLVIVCAMWLTGFDVESLATLYVDKPMKSHTLMQAIARANRVAEGKPNGLIVDYNGILQSLRNALATYASWQAENPDEEGPSEEEIDPVASPEDRLVTYVDALEDCVGYVAERGYDIEGMINATDGFTKIAELDKAVEAVTTNDRTKAEFDVRAKRLFDIARATIDMAQEQAPYKQQYNAIEAIHRDANNSTQKRSINHILADLHPQIASSIQVVRQARADYDSGRLYDISEIDFQRLQEEFTRSTRRNVTVQSLREQVEQRLQRMVGINPSRMSLYDRYQAIIQRYNEETDAQVIQQTFDDLLNLVRTMSQEQERAVQEGLSEEQLAIYDLLRSGKELTGPLVKRVKQVAEELLTAINHEIAHIDRWTEKESTQAQIETLIKDFLWDETKGLPDPDYTTEDVERLSGRVFTYVYERERRDANFGNAA